MHMIGGDTGGDGGTGVTDDSCDGRELQKPANIKSDINSSNKSSLLSSLSVLLASSSAHRVHSRVTKQSEWEDEEQGNRPSFSHPDIPLSGNAFYER